MTRDCPRDTPRRRRPPFGGRLCFRGRGSQARPAFGPASCSAEPAGPRAPCACYGANSAVGPWPIAGSARALQSWSPLRRALALRAALLADHPHILPARRIQADLIAHRFHRNRAFLGGFERARQRRKGGGWCHNYLPTTVHLSATLSAPDSIERGEGGAIIICPPERRFCYGQPQFASARLA